MPTTLTPHAAGVQPGLHSGHLSGSSSAVADRRVVLESLENAAEFQGRHIGCSPDDELRMLETIGEESCESLIAGIVPASIARHGEPPSWHQLAQLARRVRAGPTPPDTSSDRR